MTFEDGYKKLLELVPDTMEIISECGKPCFEIKIDSSLKPTGEVCFSLQDKSSSVTMNIKVDQDINLLEAYPIATCQKDRRPFKLKADEIEDDYTPYLSIDVPNNKITHIYYMNKNTHMLTRRDTEGNEREYSQYIFSGKEVQKVFDKYHPAYIFSYHPVGHPESPTAYLMGFNIYCPNYESLKDHLFQLINYNI